MNWYDLLERYWQVILTFAGTIFLFYGVFWAGIELLHHAQQYGYAR